MKRVNITCPYCHTKAFLRPARTVYGAETEGPRAKLYVCGRYPACDAYVSAYPGSLKPMGTLANKALRKKRRTAHWYLDRLWESGLMTRQEAYLLVQLYFGIPPEDAHIAKFDVDRCNKLIRFCNQYYRHAAPRVA